MGIESQPLSAPASAASLGRWHTVLLLAVLWLLSAGLQWRNAAFASDIGADPDEPAHAVTALMFRDYLAHGITAGEHPLHFAQRYYDHFPKVAVGHYPPVFYLVAGAWLLPWPSKIALMLLMSLLSAVLGVITARLAVRCGLSRTTAYIVSLWLVMLPLVQKQTMLVMSDLLLVSFMLLAAASFARFLDRPAAGCSLLFGVLASAAILTKASGIALALIPPACILLRRQWSLLWNWRLWLAPLPVLLTAGPWMFLTMKITEEGMQETSIADYVPQAARFYAEAMGYSFGAVILCGSAVALVMMCRQCKKWLQACAALPVALAVLPFCVLLLFLVSPTGLSSRYLQPLAPPMLIATAWAAGKLGGMWKRPSAEMGCVSFAAVISLLSLGLVPDKENTGHGSVAERLIRESPAAKVLVSSDARGEGSLIAELALRLPDRTSTGWTVARSSKLVATSAWTGRDYELQIKDAPALERSLAEHGIEWVVVDGGIPPPYLQPHHQLVQDWVANQKPVCSFPIQRDENSAASEIRLFRIGKAQP